MQLSNRATARFPALGLWTYRFRWPVIASHQAQDPSLRVYVTGETPISYDGTQVLVADTATAEKRIIPAAIALLLLAFGAVAAAGIPVMVGALASVITLGLLVVCGH